jgi:hypothetical protein
VFLGFNVAWLLLFEYRSPGPGGRLRSDPGAK